MGEGKGFAGVVEDSRLGQLPSSLRELGRASNHGGQPAHRARERGAGALRHSSCHCQPIWLCDMSDNR